MLLTGSCWSSFPDIRACQSDVCLTSCAWHHCNAYSLDPIARVNGPHTAFACSGSYDWVKMGVQCIAGMHLGTPEWANDLMQTQACMHVLAGFNPPGIAFI